MHPEIKEIINQLDLNDSYWNLNTNTLLFLKEIGIGQTEAIIAIHLGKHITLESVQEYVFQSNIWPHEDINEVAYKTFKYL